MCFSMIETAKANYLDPFGYLLFLLQELPKLGEKPDEEQLRDDLPWSTTVPAYCRKKYEDARYGENTLKVKKNGLL